MKLLTQVSKELKDFVYDVIKSGVFHHFKDLDYDYIDRIFASGAMAFVSTDDNDNINGVLVFYISELLPTYPGKRVAVEHMWYSHGGGGKELFSEFQTYAMYKDCSHIIMSCHHGNPMTGKIQSFYERQGYVPCETTYIKELA